MIATSMERQVESFTFSQIAIPLLIAAAGLVILGVQPILLGALVDSQQVTLDQVGLIAMAEIVCIGLGAGLAPALLPLNRFRIVTLFASIVVVGTNIASGQTDGFGDLLAARSMAGLGTGLLVWVATCVIVRFHMPDRLAGIFFTGQTLMQAAVAALFALWIIPAGNWNAGFYALGVVVLLPGLLFAGVPTSMPPLTDEEGSTPPLTIPVLLACGVVVSQMAIVGSLWTFIDPISLAAGIDQRTIQLVISGTLVMQAIGGAVAAGVAPQVNAPAMLFLGGSIQASIAAWFANYLTDSLTIFTGICAVFGFIWMFLMPMHVQLALRVDPSGRLAVFGAGLQLLGSALGPLVASVFVTQTDAAPAATVAMGFAIASVVVIALLILSSARKQATS